MNTDKKDLGVFHQGFYPRISVHPRLHLHLQQVQVSVVVFDIQALSLARFTPIMAATS
jgi:hypothetical protein